jgi:hypothetical protein
MSAADIAQCPLAEQPLVSRTLSVSVQMNLLTHTRARGLLQNQLGFQGLAIRSLV